MRRLDKINETRESLGLDKLDTLPDLGNHCDSCGEPFDEDSINGGRCTTCGTSVRALMPEEIQRMMQE